PDAPERHEGHAEDEDEGAEQPDELDPVGLREAHRAQVRRHEREDLADTEALHHRRDPEDREEGAPVLARLGGWSHRAASVADPRTPTRRIRKAQSARNEKRRRPTFRQPERALDSGGQEAGMARLFTRLIAAQDRWARPFGDFNHGWLSALF